MAKSLPDLWDTCYDGQAQGLVSPEEFRTQFCKWCVNAGCRNSKGAGTSWVHRMLTQEDRLLDNPLFGDPNDPQYREFAEMDFKDTLRKALALDISSRKGDWSVPSSEEISGAAATLVAGGFNPVGFAPALAEETVQPPERLVDQTTTTSLRPTPRTLSPVKEEPVKEEPVMRGQNKVLVQIDDIQDPAPVLGQWKIRGDSGDIYQVVQVDKDTWECSCPSRQNPCKHVVSVSQKLKRAAPAPAEAPPNPPALPPPGAPPTFKPLQGMNTRPPPEGVTIGGAPPPPVFDPWAPRKAPPTSERTLPVGGKVRFKK